LLQVFAELIREKYLAKRVLPVAGAGAERRHRPEKTRLGVSRAGMRSSSLGRRCNGRPALWFRSAPPEPGTECPRFPGEACPSGDPGALRAIRQGMTMPATDDRKTQYLAERDRLMAELAALGQVAHTEKRQFEDGYALRDMDESTREGLRLRIGELTALIEKIETGTA
jgi:hypothetical protein